MGWIGHASKHELLVNNSFFEEGVIRAMWITAAEICIILHIIRNPNSITVLILIQIFLSS